MRFPRKVLKQLIGNFSIEIRDIQGKLDASIGKEEIRLHYFLDDSYVLKIVTAKTLVPDDFNEMNMIMNNYRSMGIETPKLIETKEHSLYKEFVFKKKTFYCYVETYLEGELLNKYESVNKEPIFEQVFALLAKYSTKFKDQNVIQKKSMWALDLKCVDDVYKDEKFENLIKLCDTLTKIGEIVLASRIKLYNKELRNALATIYRDLPRCNYQGDLNSSNVLVKNDSLYGLIDFNLFGQEVVVNCFLDETAYFLDGDFFMKNPAKEQVDDIRRDFQRNFGAIKKYYSFSELERKAVPIIQRIILLSFYPNVIHLTYFLELGGYDRMMAIDYLNYILELDSKDFTI